jgi:hypothetical protein
MTLRKAILVCATICTALLVALMVGAVLYATSHPGIYTHGPFPPPDDDQDKGPDGIAHGPFPPPDDDQDKGPDGARAL